MYHREHHRLNRSGWLRASVLGGNDGILSTASLMVGVASAQASQADVLLAGIAGLVAGAMSMAAGEYVSVKSQADTEAADLKMEAAEILTNPVHEENELAEIYRERGLDDTLAGAVAKQMMEHDALAAHARDEIGISDSLSARPIQAALASGATFAVGAAIPVLTGAFVPSATAIWLIPAVTVVLLAALGALGAWVGGASMLRGAARVCIWGSLAMLLTAAVGKMVGVSVS